MVHLIRVRVLALAASVAFTFGVVAQADAAFITGSIRLGGALAPTDFTTTNSIDIASNEATLLQNPSQPFTGDYVPVNTSGGSAVYNDFTFNPLPGTPVTPLWIFTRGGIEYSFDLWQVTSFSRHPPGLNGGGIIITGFGAAKITGFEPTLANWSFSADTAGGTTAFSSTILASGQAAVVPEPGSIALVGIALFGWAARRRARSS